MRRAPGFLCIEPSPAIGPGTIAKRQVMPPVATRLRRQVVAALDHAHMFAQNAALGRNGQPIGIDPQDDRSIGERRRNAAAISLKAPSKWAGRICSVR